MASWGLVIGRVLLLSSLLQSYPPERCQRNHGPSGVVIPIESLAGAYHYMIGADDRGVICFISSLVDGCQATRQRFQVATEYSVYSCHWV